MSSINLKKKTMTILLAVLMTVLAVLPGCGSAEKTSDLKVGIIGAMDEEVVTLKEALKEMKVTKIAEMEFCEGKLGDKSVVVVKCGMGKVNAGICAHTLINYFGCTRVINTGVAGSLDNRLDIGDLVVSIDAVQHDFTVEAIGFEKGEIPYTGLYAFPADEEMRKAALEAQKEVAPNTHAFEGRICSGDQFISENEQKEKIIAGIAHYEPAGERMRLIRKENGALLLSDCYNANPQSMAAAIDTLAKSGCGKTGHTGSWRESAWRRKDQSEYRPGLRGCPGTKTGRS